MKFCDRLLLFCSLMGVFGLVTTSINPILAQTSSRACPTPALERFQRHKVARGETLDSIAQRYNLDPETIISMNPALKNRRVAIGNDLLLPPYDGFVIEVTKGETWQQLGQKYKVRADALFELNGCQPPSNLAFIPVARKPVANTSTSSTSEATNPAKIAGYPLPEVARVGFPYGWQIHPQNGEVFFHSGIDLLAAKDTPVKAIAPGTVVFAGDQGSYGNLVIINHGGGLQSRYAQLDSIKVTVGQKVDQGDLLGTVGTTGQPTINQPHLHFEMRSSSSLGWVAKDPRGYFKQQ